jgi:flavin reductase (DIM6/NTAB) family NADH-FMN oxidoreductase RutF
LKIEIGPKNCLYPMPTTVVGTMVDGKPNYITIAHVGILDFETVSLGSAKSHYSNKGINDNGTFSINIPSAEQVEKTDYVGIVSGKDVDKSSIFRAFYGKLRTAPMIEEFPINMECELIQALDLPKHDIFIGRIVETYCDDSVMTDGTIDFEKLDPILYTHFDRGYWRLGDKLANAWNVGKRLEEKWPSSVNPD